MREAGMRGITRALGRFSAQSVGIAAVVCAAMAAGTTTAAAQDSANVESSPLTVQQLDARDDQASTGGGVVQPMSASGCTFAPGNFGALNCIYVNGEGDFVNYIRATYDTGGSPWPGNVCDLGYEYMYTLYGYTTPTHIVQQTPQCGIGGFLTYSNTIQVNRRLAHYTDVCTRTRNTATNNEWTNWACVTIIP